MWKATTGDSVLFEGNDKVMALSAFQTEAYTLLRRFMEAKKRHIKEIKVILDFARLIQALKHQHNL